MAAFSNLLSVFRRNKDQSNHARGMNEIAMRRAFEAASGSSRWPDAAHMPSLSAAMAYGRDRMADRASYLTANSPHAAGMALSLVSGISGKGHILNTANPDIDRRFRTWARNATTDGRSLASLQATVARDIVVKGEAFVLFRYIDGRLALKQIDPKQVDAAKTQDLGNGRRIINGIELDENDRRVRYWILPTRPGDPFAEVRESVPVDAEDCLHIFQSITGDQLRGITWFHGNATRLIEIDQLEDALLVKNKIAALFAGFIKSLSGSNPFPEQNGEIKMEPGTLSMLPPDTDVTFTPGMSVGDTPQFLKSMLKSAAAAVGLSYELATGDLADTNYSSYRAGHLEFRRKCECWQAELMVNRLLDPIFARWQIIEFLSGRPVDLDTEPEWLAPAWGMVDPAKETGAEIKAVEAGLKSRREVIAGRGRDPDTVLAEIASDKTATMEGKTNA